jgi:hypothetical protein
VIVCCWLVLMVARFVCLFVCLLLLLFWCDIDTHMHNIGAHLGCATRVCAVGTHHCSHGQNYVVGLVINGIVVVVVVVIIINGCGCC